MTPSKTFIDVDYWTLESGKKIQLVYEADENKPLFFMNEGELVNKQIDEAKKLAKGISYTTEKGKPYVYYKPELRTIQDIDKE